jgi:hypothetical protein
MLTSKPQFDERLQGSMIHLHVKTKGSEIVMKNYLARLIMAVVFGAVVGFYTFYDYSKWGLRGKEAFMLHQSQRFDRYMANPRLALSILEAVVVVIILILYEFGVAAIARVIASRRPGNPAVC